MPYCTKEDLLTGDIPLAGKYGDGSSFVQLAADEIDAQIGHIYVTPIELEESPETRPARLLLKKINTLLASGRIILDMAAAGEDNNLHAYGASMLKEARELLEMIYLQKIILTDAELIAEEADRENTGPSIIQDDPVSLVETFYKNYSQPYLPGFPPVPMRPYADPVGE